MHYTELMYMVYMRPIVSLSGPFNARASYEYDIITSLHNGMPIANNDNLKLFLEVFSPTSHSKFKFSSLRRLCEIRNYDKYFIFCFFHFIYLRIHILYDFHLPFHIYSSCLPS